MSVHIASVASTEYGKHGDASSRELLRDVAIEIFDATAIAPQDIDAVYVGNFMGDLIEDQGHMGALVADYIGAHEVQSVRVESACASGGAAVHQAVNAIESGAVDVAFVCGVEMMSIAAIDRLTDALANAADDIYENEQGLTFPGIYALMARRYMHEFDVTHEELAAVSVKNRGNALANPIAQLGEDITVDDVLESPSIASPLTLYDVCPVTDGASGVVLVSDTFAAAHDLTTSIPILGIGQSGDALALQERASITGIPSAARAADAAFEHAGVGPDDIDVVEVHDCFTIAEVLALESIGFYETGEGVRGALNDETTVDGEFPVNTSGGLLGKGHPVGVTGVGQLVELTKQLEGRHPNQVSDPTTALAHNVGGSGASTTVTILGSE